jgi:hypothetical protein
MALQVFSNPKICLADWKPTNIGKTFRLIVVIGTSEGIIGENPMLPIGYPRLAEHCDFFLGHLT